MYFELHMNKLQKIKSFTRFFIRRLDIVISIYTIKVRLKLFKNLIRNAFLCNMFFSRNNIALNSICFYIELLCKSLRNLLRIIFQTAPTKFLMSYIFLHLHHFIQEWFHNQNTLFMI